MSLLTKQDRYSLIQGYCKKYSNKDIPHDLSSLVLLFYDEIIDFKITDIDHFFNCTVKQVVIGPKFFINNIPFQLQIYPNGYTDMSSNHVQLLIDCPRDIRPKDIKSFCIYYELCLFETNYQFRRTLYMPRPGAFDHGKWYRYSINT